MSPSRVRCGVFGARGHGAREGAASRERSDVASGSPTCAPQRTGDVPREP